MNLKEKIINGSGYSVVKIDDLDQFQKLRDIFIEKMGLEGVKNITNLREKIAKMISLFCSKFLQNKIIKK